MMHPWYSKLISYSQTFISMGFVTIINYTNCATKTSATAISAIYVVTQILANEIMIATFSLLPMKYGINFTAVIGTFVWAIKQIWYY